MNTEKLNELRNNAQNAIKDLYEATEDKKCLHCIDFRYNPARAGAPENTPHAYCEYLETSWVCGDASKVERLMECILANAKTLIE